MPSINQNKAQWDQSYEWSERGDEWSHGFGNSETLWWFILYPRIHCFLPNASILEIAPGFGRWTHYLKDLCQRLTIVDLSAKCIEQCQKRFAGIEKISYHVNDGKSLDFVPDRSVDFVFSFDSLVHAEREVIEAYLAQFARILSPNGIAFIHHSNMGQYANTVRIHWRLPKALRIAKAFSYLRAINLSGWRATSMTHTAFRELSEKNQLSCISQELISWTTGKCMIDALSVVTPRGSVWDRPYQLMKNPDFVKYSKFLQRLSSAYSTPLPELRAVDSI